MKATKIVDQGREIVVKWNPVKELKGNRLATVECSGWFPWNPVKELKESQMDQWVFLAHRALVESGEGIEKEDLPVETHEPRNPDSLT